MRSTQRNLSEARKIANPCVQICVTDSDHNICLGCGRTKDEVLDWARLPRDVREDIVPKLDERLKTLENERRKRRRGRRRKRMAGSVSGDL